MRLLRQNIPPYRQIYHISGLEIKCFFSREPNCIFKSYLLKFMSIETSASLGLPAEIWGSPKRIQGSPQLPAPPYFEPCVSSHNTSQGNTHPRQGLSRYLETGCPNRGFIDFCVSKVWYKKHTTNKIDPIP